MAISQLKRRYSVSLTPANVNRFQSVCKKLGLPPATMSNAFDDMLCDLSATFEAAIEKGSMELSDLFKVMGKQLELKEQYTKEEGKIDQKEVSRKPNKTAKSKAA